MSAYLCSFATFDALAQASQHYGVQVYLPNLPLPLQREIQAQYDYAIRGYTLDLKGLGEQDVGQILWAENWRSLNARYPDTPTNRADTPGIIAEVAKDYRYHAPHSDMLSPLQIIKACHCLNYQSCESDDYEQTLAFHILEAIERAAVRKIPGYDDAPWGLSEDDVRRPARRA